MSRDILAEVVNGIDDEYSWCDELPAFVGLCAFIGVLVLIASIV